MYRFLCEHKYNFSEINAYECLQAFPITLGPFLFFFPFPFFFFFRKQQADSIFLNGNLKM